jgi:hypothetical protein
MNDSQRLQLQRMISENEVEDQTGLIRELKHSQIFRKEIPKLIEIRDSNLKKGDTAIGFGSNTFSRSAQECNFMYSYYTDIFNKILKNEIDMDTMFSFIDVLSDIETGLLGQHEGAFKVGTLLKKLYVDSALLKADRIDEDNKNMEDAIPLTKPAAVKISWNEYKQLNK